MCSSAPIRSGGGILRSFNSISLDGTTGGGRLVIAGINTLFGDGGLMGNTIKPSPFLRPLRETLPGKNASLGGVGLLDLEDLHVYLRFLPPIPLPTGDTDFSNLWELDSCRDGFNHLGFVRNYADVTSPVTWTYMRNTEYYTSKNHVAWIVTMLTSNSRVGETNAFMSDSARKTNYAIAVALRHFNTYNWTGVTSDHPLYYMRDVFVGQILGENNQGNGGVAAEAFSATM